MVDGSYEQLTAYLADKTAAHKWGLADRFIRKGTVTREQMTGFLGPRPPEEDVAAAMAALAAEAAAGRAALNRAATDKAKAGGPGTELIAIFDSLSLESCDACKILAARMNHLGSAGCRKAYWRIVGELKDRAAQRPVAEWITAATMAALTGLAFKINWSDPIPDLVMLAVTRAEAKGL